MGEPVILFLQIGNTDVISQQQSRNKWGVDYSEMILGEDICYAGCCC
jgi:hypothetical protein